VSGRIVKQIFTQSLDRRVHDLAGIPDKMKVFCIMQKATSRKKIAKVIF
jgi:hypothetical protein